MPLFMVERSSAQTMDLRATEAKAIMAINAEVGVDWLLSFLSADKKKTYCLYEAPSAEPIREAARRAGIPVDAVIEVSEQRPEMFTSASAG